MELEVSAWTRRDRLERIAAAERDRRAGRTSLALAALGEGTEWPARLVFALAKLAEDEGGETRAILERTLDDWATESGIASLDPDASAPEAEEVQAAASDGDEDELVVDAVDALAAPIGFDELERAFASAEAQTDEMHGVNDVAEQVLMDEPIGLAELDGQTFDATEEVAVDADPVAAIETDAAWAERPIWPEPQRDASVLMGGSDDREAPEVAVEDSSPTRTQVTTTLERWLDNLRAGRAR